MPEPRLFFLSLSPGSAPSQELPPGWRGLVPLTVSAVEIAPGVRVAPLGTGDFMLPDRTVGYGAGIGVWTAGPATGETKGRIMTNHPFAAEAEIVKRATGLPAAIAADLTVFGGILRCESCHGERPLDDITGYLRTGWPQHCGKTMTWVTLKLLAAESREVPDGYELAAVADADWRTEAGKLCVQKLKGRRTCRRPSVAALNRRQYRAATMTRVDAWWPYCQAHLFGRWIESGSVMHWILRETGGGEP